MTGLSKKTPQPKMPPPYPKQEPLQDLPVVEDAPGLAEKKKKSATLGLDQFIWLPVGVPPK
jgi:hypothetical protein